MITSQKNTSAENSRLRQDEQNILPDWLMFPFLNDAWTASPAQTIASIGERIAAYRKLSDTASPAERSKSRLIAQAYTQVHAVLQELLKTTQNEIASGERKNT